LTEETKSDNAFENYDLKAEAPEARKPAVRFAFEFPALLDRFRPEDALALSSRRQSRIFGFVAVSLVLFALLLASTGPLLTTPGHEPAADSHGEGLGLNLHTILGLIAAVLGLGGTALGIMGARKSSARRKWLHARLRTETLRLFHFHFIAARLPQIVEIGEDPAKQAAYRTERSAALAELERRVLTDAEAELQRIIDRGEETTFPSITPMMQVSDDAPNPANASDIFAAWRALRLDWQAGYCEAKLAHRRKDTITPRRLEEVFAWWGLGCVTIIIVVHLAHFLATLMGRQFPLGVGVLEVVVIWVALIALAGRALEDGFAPQREVERYEQYRANVRVAAERFDGARSFAQRLDAMRAFERTSLEEMRVFMRTHARARFLL
jgi:hypothetical protein